MTPSATRPAPLLQIQGLRKGYGERTAVLEQVDLTLQDAEFVSIMGESGSGKSTLLNLIAGLDRSDQGSVQLEGVDLGSLTDDERTRLRRRAMGFIFQAFHVLPYLTALQNVLLPLQLLHVPAERGVKLARECLERCGIGALQARYPRELSGGELQRIAIARALVHRPRLLLADEPTGNLDARAAAQILQLLREQLRETGAGAILITHSATAAASADRTLRLTGGRLTARPQMSAAQGL
ncbi:MAG TPA: ABC transporter ATP-binding protein [Steroidobacteraceae bacterium]|nr:ABC transporter ATP-binding protein [Steroidobacteraceae bacterium]